jgi:hypothetical protein
MQVSKIFYLLVCLAFTAGDNIMCPNLGSAVKFTVIACSTVTNAGNIIINGDLAISPSVALAGFSSFGVINGVTHLGNGIALQAQKDVTTAYNFLTGAPVTAVLTNVDLGGKTYTPGVYRFDSTAGINVYGDILTLDGSGIYIFQIGSALTTSINSQIKLINGAKASCIFWQVGSSATLGQNSIFVGNILAYASIGLASGITFTGSAYARTGAVTFISGTITGQTRCDLC